jgi:hypothetical protein
MKEDRRRGAKGSQEETSMIAVRVHGSEVQRFTVRRFTDEKILGTKIRNR